MNNDWAEESDRLRNLLQPHMDAARYQTINCPPITTWAVCSRGKGMARGGRRSITAIIDDLAKIVGPKKAERYGAALEELAKAQRELLKVEEATDGLPPTQ